MRLVALLALGVSLSAAPALAQDDDKPSLLIMAFTAEGVPARSATSAEDLTASAFSRTGRFNIIAGSDLEQMMQLESNKMALGCNEGECLAEIADALGADFVVTGRMSRLGELFVLKLSVLKPSAAKTMTTETFQVKSLEDLAFELSMAGQRMTLVTFGEEVPPALQASNAGANKPKSDDEVKALVAETIKQQKEEERGIAGPIAGWTALGAAGVAGALFIGGIGAMALAYPFVYSADSSGFLKGIGRTVGNTGTLGIPLGMVAILVASAAGITWLALD